MKRWEVAVSVSLKEKLFNDLMVGYWKDIKLQVSHGAVFAVLNHDLLDVGIALATDDTVQIGALLQSGQLQRVTVEKSAQLPDEQRCRFLIIRPYVLIQVVAQK